MSTQDWGAFCARPRPRDARPHELTRPHAIPSADPSRPGMARHGRDVRRAKRHPRGWRAAEPRRPEGHAPEAPASHVTHGPRGSGRASRSHHGRECLARNARQLAHRALAATTRSLSKRGHWCCVWNVPFCRGQERKDWTACCIEQIEWRAVPPSLEMGQHWRDSAKNDRDWNAKSQLDATLQNLSDFRRSACSKFSTLG